MTPFFAAEPPEVRAVIELASLLNDGDDRAANLIDVHYPGRRDTFDWIAEQLRWIDRFSYDASADALREYEGVPTRRYLYPDVHADQVRGELQRDVLASAQLVASVRLAVAS